MLSAAGESCCFKFATWPGRTGGWTGCRATCWTPSLVAGRQPVDVDGALEHLVLYPQAERAAQRVLDALRRRTTFEEVTGALGESTARFEVWRCLSCGNCFECDNCYGLCPDNAVVKLGRGERYRIDYDFGKGCGLCAAECPCGAIQMIPETI